MNQGNLEYTEWDVEVAKRIACAVTSYQAGVSYEEIWDQFAGHKEGLGTFWLSIAKQIREGLPHKPK